VAPRRFAALFHAARVPGVALQSFPLSRSRTRSRGPLLPCGFAFDRRRRDDHRARAVLSPWSQPFAAACPKAGRTHGLGDRVPRTAGIGPSCAPKHADRSHSRSKTVGLAGKRPARPLRSFAPLVSPFSRRPPPWPG